MQRKLVILRKSKNEESREGGDRQTLRKERKIETEKNRKIETEKDRNRETEKDRNRER